MFAINNEEKLTVFWITGNLVHHKKVPLLDPGALSCE